MPRDSRMRQQQLLEQAQGYLMLEMPRQALDRLAALDDAGFEPLLVSKLRGEALRLACRYDEALDAFHAALAHLAESPGKRSDRVEVLLAMAWCYKRIDQLPRAIAVTTEANRLESDNPLVMYNLACYYSLDGNKPQALAWLGRAIRKQAAFRDLVAEETDFDSLRDDPDFQFVAGLRNAADSR